MFSSKTTTLLAWIEQREANGEKVLVLSSSKDTRTSSQEIHSHCGGSHSAIKCTHLMNFLKENREKVERAQYIAIDEGQFFDDLIVFCDLMIDWGKSIAVAALNGDYRRKPFGSVGRLLSLCTSIELMHARCAVCKGKASYTQRKGQRREIELIGGHEYYQAVCPSCYVEKEGK